MGAPKGNDYNRRYTLEEAITLLTKALEYAQTNEDCLSVQDAIFYIKIPHSTFYDLCKKHKELDNIKSDINNAVVMRINKGALKNKFNSTAAIWRMKQLGETDKQEITQRNINTDLDLTEEEIKKELKRLRGID